MVLYLKTHLCELTLDGTRYARLVLGIVNGLLLQPDLLPVHHTSIRIVGLETIKCVSSAAFRSYVFALQPPLAHLLG